MCRFIGFDRTSENSSGPGLAWRIRVAFPVLDGVVAGDEIRGGMKDSCGIGAGWGL